MKLTIETFMPDDDCIWIAKCNELDCCGDGVTEIEAIEDLTKAILDILEIAKSDGVI